MSELKSGVLAIIDTTRIQSYIYRSNRLAENIGASHLVYLATDVWVQEMLDRHGGTKVSSGGGNFVALLPNQAKAKAFTRDLSQRVLESAPGLEIRVGLSTFDAENDFLGDTIHEGLKQLNAADKTSLRSSDTLGLGVSAVCQSTGLPANGKVTAGTDTFPAAAEIVAKTKSWFRDNAERQLNNITELPDSYVYPRDFDELGRTKGDESMIAVVHADGNGIGQVVQSLARRYEEQVETKAMTVSDANAKYLATLRAFSEALTTVTWQAVADTIDVLVKWLALDVAYLPSERERRVLRQMQHNVHRHRLVLPLRPLIIGGDDVTLVCDGRLGVSLAKVYLEHFTRHALEANFSQIVGEPTTITACAGVAIVKTHYPFARAYQLADDLCSNAKRRRRDESGNGSYLDWHFARTGMVSTDLADIRAREYGVSKLKVKDVCAGKDVTHTARLTLRPLSIENTDERSWSVVEDQLNALQGHDENNREKWPRSKRKALQEALLGGPTETQRWAAIYANGELPQLDAKGNTVSETGFVEVDIKVKCKQPSQKNTSVPVSHCVYYDALELIDSYIDIEIMDRQEANGATAN